MPESNQYAFTYVELITMMLKAADVHEGLWTLNVLFTFAAGNIGQAPTALNPTAILTIPGIGISRVTEAPPLGGSNIVVDAAKVNPAAKSRK